MKVSAFTIKTIKRAFAKAGVMFISNNFKEVSSPSKIRKIMKIDTSKLNEVEIS